MAGAQLELKAITRGGKRVPLLRPAKVAETT